MKILTSKNFQESSLHQNFDRLKSYLPKKRDQYKLSNSNLKKEIIVVEIISNIELIF